MRNALLTLMLISGLVSTAQSVDFTHMQLLVEPDTNTEKIAGEVGLSFKVAGSPDSLYLNAIRMEYSEVSLNGRKADFGKDETGIWIYLPVGLPDSNHLFIKYSCQPRKGIYFVGWKDDSYRARRQIWTQGQGIDHRHWIPHRDDQTDKLIIDISVRFSDKYQPMVNGKIQSVKTLPNGRRQWNYKMEKPMSSYLIAISLAKYTYVNSESLSGVPLTQYYYPDRAKDYSFFYYQNEAIFNFLEEEIGMAYPWQNYKQAPVQDFRHGAMENTTATIFGDFFLVDAIAFNDENYTYVNAHELAHQWFGNLVTASGSDEHWLHEGFATYYQWLSQQHLYGKNRFDWDRYIAAMQVFQASQNDEVPLGNSKAGSARFYQKGAWVLFMLRQALGDSLYRETIKDYLTKNAFGIVNTSILNASIKEVSGRDFSGFFKLWVDSAGEPKIACRSYLKGKSLRLEGRYQGNFFKDSNFKLPVEIYFTDGTSRIEQIAITDTGAFSAKVKFKEKIDFWVVNPNMSLLVQLYEQKSLEDLQNQLRSPHVLDQYQAINSLTTEQCAAVPKLLQNLAENESTYYQVRALALKRLLAVASEDGKSALKKLLISTNVQLQKEALRLVPRAWVQELRPQIFPLKSEESYELRVSAIHMLIDRENLEENRWLYDDRYENEPGIPGHKVLVPCLAYRSLLYYDKGAEARLIDLSSSSFDFLTRMNAMEAMAAISLVSPRYVHHVFVALFDNNWKLSSAARRELQRIKMSQQGAEMIVEYIEENGAQWDYFQKRKVQRTFETK